MKRSVRGLGVIVVCLALVSGCGGDDKDPAAAPSSPATVDAQGRLVLGLTAGSTITVPAPGSTGVISEETPVSLEFSGLECAPRLPDLGYNRKGRNVDLVAKDGNQLCLVALAVTNTGEDKNFFSSRVGPGVRFAALQTADGQEYGLTRKRYDQQGIADARGQQLASTADLIKPGETKYDYAIYEIPAGSVAAAVVYDVAAVG